VNTASCARNIRLTEKFEEIIMVSYRICASCVTILGFKISAILATCSASTVLVEIFKVGAGKLNDIFGLAPYNRLDKVFENAREVIGDINLLCSKNTLFVNVRHDLFKVLW